MITYSSLGACPPPQENFEILNYEINPCNVHVHTCTKQATCLHVVEDGEDDTKEHLAYSKNDSRLHLVGVGEHKLVVSNTPDLTENGKNNKEYILVQLSYTCIYF